MKENKNFKFKPTDSDGQININFDEQQEENNGDEKVIHLDSEEDFKNLEAEHPVEHKALIEEMERIKEQEEIDAREKSAFVQEEAEKLEQEEAEELEQKKVELREALNKAYESSTVDDKDDDPGGYKHTAEIARQIRDKKIEEESKKLNKKINNNKNKKGRWRRGWDSIQDRFNSK